MLRSAFVTIVVLLAAVPERQARADCPMLAAEIAGEPAGPPIVSFDKPVFVRALVAFWWQSRRLPMRAMPDRVRLFGLEAGSHALSFERDGCVLASMTVRGTVLWRYLDRHIGRPA